MKKPIEPALQLDVGGLKCDAAGCGFRCDEIAREDYEHFIDTACPLCGANLLTAADYRAVVRLEKVVAFANRWLSWLPGMAKPKTYDAGLNGSGRFNFTQKPDA